MKKLTIAAAIAASTLLTSPAFAGDSEGKIQIKLLGTAVLADGSLTDVTINPGLPAESGTKANDNYVPSIAIEYFISPQLSVETICCLTQHDVDGTGALAGAELVSDAKILPATLTLKYHFDAGAFKPYIGAGPSYFVFIDEKPGAGSSALLGATRTRVNDKLGFALQAGVDIPINDKGMAITFDAKRYFLRTSAHWFNAGGTEVLATRHRLDPWVISGGLAFRF